MKSWIIIVFASLSLILGGCNPTSNSVDESLDDIKEVKELNYNFVGESENWEAELVFKGEEIFIKDPEGDINDYNTRTQSDFKLEYKGELSEIAGSSLSYSYDTGSEGSEGTREDLDKKVIESHGGSKNGSIIPQDSIIEVTVEWNGEKENFILENTDSQ
ncbi:hypothetical protein [Bacillus sp. SG-1]|uniref:hypothetical protein n=1 Tax=Bacillus sp. SG-1 TaxID=161544 RepID=UPI0001543128|nr:hypothetical protein [Bacillus sp. SG-1]EDL65749.1 hypothetical protein BSG1_12781 [Bacillus sp. SG-1]EDL66533.1 hypothetical protein BSG1_04235 [Bacillus sp. SG-1]